MQQQRTLSMAASGRGPMSVADVFVQLSELSCRMDQLEEHWNDPEALRLRLAQLVAAQHGRQLRAAPAAPVR
jgi:hypothetical protein